MDKIPSKVYIASVASLEDEGLYALALAAASPERREKTLRFRFPKDRRLSLGAELLLRKALQELGAARQDLSYTYGENGKPFLSGLPGLHFNLSHSGERVMCAVSGGEVGCDIEQMRDVDLKIARRYFFHGEYERIAAAATEAERADLFFRYWTLKESFLKATGRGLSLPLDAFQIVLPPRGGESEISVVQSVDRRAYRFQEFHTGSAYRCAVCWTDGFPAPAAEEVDLARFLAGK